MNKKLIVMVGSFITLLAACGANSSTTNFSSNRSSATTQTAEATTESTTTVAKPSGKELYRDVLDYFEAIREKGMQLLTSPLELAPVIQESMNKNPNEFYIHFRDLNEDGINELLLAHKEKSDDSQYYMHAVYYLEDGTTPKLAVQGFTGSGGARQGFNVYPEGKLSEVGFSSGTGNGSIFVYQLTKDSKRELIAKKEFERLEFELEDVGLNQNDIIDYQDFNWQPLFN